MDPAGDAGVSNSARDGISSAGQQLDGATRRSLEKSIDADGRDVRIHTGLKSAQAADAINARASGVGNYIAFNHGEYDPSSADGQHLIDHELAHVRQQTGGAVSMLPQSDADLESDPDPHLEREVDQVAREGLSGGQCRSTGWESHREGRDRCCR